jgi:hypothetical protein
MWTLHPCIDDTPNCRTPAVDDDEGPPSPPPPPPPVEEEEGEEEGDVDDEEDPSCVSFSVTGAPSKFPMICEDESALEEEEDEEGNDRIE